MPISLADHSLIIAAKLAPLARLAYSASKDDPKAYTEMERELRQSPWTSWKSYETANALALKVEDEHSCVLAIAGTYSIRDFMDDLDVSTLTVRSSCEAVYGIHAGFRRHAGKLLASGITVGRAKPLLLVGHSLGGAVATVLPLVSKLKPQLVVTFGAPLCVSKETSWKYNFQTVHVARPIDFVPFMPRVQFLQPGRQFWLMENGKIRNGKLRTALLRRYWNFLTKTLLLGWGIDETIIDAHSMQRYEELLTPGIVWHQL